MPCYIRMKRSFLQGLLWLYLYGFGFMALSLEPGFLDFDNLPDTNFSCVGKVIGGYYADLETNCQMFHVCTIGQLDEPMDIRFLCLNGTVFDQETRVCERIDEVDCTKSEQFYSLNLELYGHSQFSNLEENSETDQPLIIKSTLPTTTTTTSTRSPPRKTTHVPFYTSVTPPTITTLENRLSSSGNHNHHSKGTNHASSTPSHISAHHFPVINPSATDIRFNPEEINISLHPGAPPDIRTNPVSYYSDKNSENQLVATTHRSVFDKSPRDVASVGSSTQQNRYNGFTFRDEDSGEFTEPPESFRIRTEFRPSQGYAAALQNPHHQLYKSSTFRNDYTLSTLKVNGNVQQKSSTTLRNYFVQSLKPPTPGQQDHYGTPHTEKNFLPQLPSLPTLTFSSPAPFSLQQRNEQKRYTKEHLPPPRIVISASASVSDASGKRLNYSLGTIGAAQLFKPPPRSYDEYKDEDVALDPFYLDVPKVTKPPRRKRSAEEKGKRNYEIRSDEEALHLLKYLFEWYKNEKTNPARYTTPLSTPLDLDGISSINHELAPETEYEKEDDNIDLIFNTSNTFGKNTEYNSLGNDASFRSNEAETKINKIHEKYTIKHETDKDYVNDNYEPLTYKEYGRKHHEEEDKKYTIPDDYVDDNIEPIYFKERDRDYYSSAESTTEYETTPSSYFEIENTLTTDVPPATTTDKDDYFYTSTTEFIPTITENPFVTTSSIETGYTITSSTTTTENPRRRNKGRRGKLKYSDINREESIVRRKTSLEKETIEDEEILQTTTQVTVPAEDIDDGMKEVTKPTEDGITTATTSFDDVYLFDQTTESLVKDNGTKEETNWSTDLKTMIKNIESNTNSLVASKIYKQKPTEAFTDIESTTTTLTEESTTIKEDSTGMNLIKITIEDETTEPPLTTESDKETTSNEIVLLTEDVSTTIRIPTTLEQFTIESTTERQDSTETTSETTNETTSETTTETTTTKKPKRRGGKYAGRKSEAFKKSGYRHRFSAGQVTRRSRTREPVVEEEIVKAISQKDVISSTEHPRSPTKRKDLVLTDYPLRKSVNPTQAESNIVTTPYSQRTPIFFNCFGKNVDKFYPDLRDCRLFHYCTQGYTKNQLLDLKFVCDFNTFFDDEKLICTKTKPKRCL